MLAWLRRRFVTGLLLAIPLVASVLAISWLITFIDSGVTGVMDWLIGWHVPGAGILAAATLVLGLGIVATNVMGRRLVGGVEGALLHVPVFRAIYGPIKQLIDAFAPGNAAGFKRVVLVQDPLRGLLLGFLTREFTVDRGAGVEAWLAVYVPTNHLYLGDVVLVRREHAVFPELTVEQGVRVFLTGGVALPERLGLPTPAETPKRD